MRSRNGFHYDPGNRSDTYWWDSREFSAHDRAAAALLAGGADLLSIYHLAMFIDELILLTGTWLLARRFFDVPATCFVALSVVASAVWLDQPYWNFRLHYAVPLVLELGHRFLDTGRWRWAFLTANLLAHRLPYLIPLTSFRGLHVFHLLCRRSAQQRADRLRSPRVECARGDGDHWRRVEFRRGAGAWLSEPSSS